MNKRINAAVSGAVASVLGARVALADDLGPDIASAGNGGVATASANGGAVGIGNINSGGNVCNAIGIGDTIGPDPAVYGGDCFNATDIAVSVDGGVAIADASGGNYNLAFVS
jgi:hypothetical protein